MPSFIVALLDRGILAAMRQVHRQRVKPRRRVCPAKSGHAERGDIGGRAVPDVVKVARLRLPRFPRRDAIEVLVVALDPEERTRRRWIRARPAGEIADADPVRHVWMALHGVRQRVEVSVDVSDRADDHPAMAGRLASGAEAAAGSGTSMSSLSQMKSSLL